MRYGQQTIEEACRQTIAMLHRQVPESGGVIAIDAQGNFCLIFNTPGMYRGYMLEHGKPEVAIYK
jgi:beta-aspartyl-peptidase (threonine type)